MEVKCVVVGDGAVGKTCLLMSYIEEKFPYEYVPTVFDNYEQDTTLNGQEIKFSLWDTAGQEGYTKIRTLSYPKTDIFLLCFSVVNPTSFSNVKDQWWKEITHHCPNGRIILVGTKIDLREETATLEELKQDGKEPISIEQGKAKAEELGLLTYLECSALTQQGLKDVFECALSNAIIPPTVPSTPTSRGSAQFQTSTRKKKGKNCSLM
eukprot:TRINITY_DN10674_c0_g1_i1.p1 TRINITY_DN10674_c0_g1~~TRINITY_DN10674_c0_g1_i1.p1  ORF type:complete len:209 (+),score=30.69 TRINITY_DN10674_c0_g1_i1:172-798(+)